jgi:hypothetical protein
MTEALGTNGGGSSDRFILVHPVTRDNPQGILRDESYRGLTRLKQHIAAQISPS